MAGTNGNTPLPVVKLYKLRRPAGRVEVEPGRVVDVMHLSGEHAQEIADVGSGGEGTRNPMMIMYDAAASVMPALSRAEVMKLDIEQVAAVLAIATKEAERVEALIRSLSEHDEKGPQQEGEEARPQPVAT